MTDTITSGRWPVVGNVDLSDNLKQDPLFYIFNNHNKKFYLYKNGQQIPATKEECLHFEPASVWSDIHVEERLEDYFAGRPNKWVELYKKNFESEN